MYSVLDKVTIEMEIVPYIAAAKRGFPQRVALSEIIDAVLYKLKTDVQWEQLPVRSLFSGKALAWQGVYCHFNKWGRSETFKDCRARFLARHRGKLDLSSAELDGSHTPAIRGGQGVAYQGRKKRKTTNALYLTDRQGLPLAMSEPGSGDQNDLCDIEVQFELVTATLEEADIPVEGLFLNADVGSGSREFRRACGKKEVNANICSYKRNGNTDSDEYFDVPSVDQTTEASGYRLGKYEYKQGLQFDMSNDVPLLRYADVLMIKGEALLRTGNAEEAARLVTQVPIPQQEINKNLNLEQNPGY